MEALTGLLTLAGTVITTAGTIAVAIITTRTRNERKAQDYETKRMAGAIEDRMVERLDKIEQELKANSKVTTANARGMVSQVYTQYKTKKALPEKTWQNVMDLYGAYKSEIIDGHVPNSWCDALVEEMKTWDKI